MPQNFITCDRDQPMLLPPDLRDWLSGDHLAWFVLAVAELDLERRSVDGASVPDSYLELDRTARAVIKTLVAKKRGSGLVVGLDGLQGALDYAVGVGTLRRMIDDGRLVPDFVDPSSQHPLSERTTYQAFLRRVFGETDFKGLLSERDLARALDLRVSVIRRRVERDQMAAAWVHRGAEGRVHLFFTESDLARIA